MNYKKVNSVNKSSKNLEINLFPLGILPDTFTICSSLHIKYVTEWIHFYQLYSVSN